VVRAVDIDRILVTDETAAVVALVLAVGGDGEGLGAAPEAVDDVDVVEGEVVGEGAQGGGEVVAAGLGCGEGVLEGYAVGGVALVVGCVAVDDELA
jgi:hypothetical protein